MYIAASSSSCCIHTLAVTDATCSHEVAAQSQSRCYCSLLPPPSLLPLATILHLETSPPQDKLFLKCHIKLNQLWVLMQCSLISSYFHDFIKEQTMMLKVFPDDDLGSVMIAPSALHPGLTDAGQSTLTPDRYKRLLTDPGLTPSGHIAP
ncbi:hypothetical protein BHE74_00024919 [Ensete ventricosum]|nr:hypothetical protein BHE74_00024919 [Ensete ventricosum]RZR96688.1 hypothetical protein BHM03_00025738 [Ensete ventricosum]